ncbi:MAG: nucleotidyltransferase family protein [Tepidanaerobacteraceae bacterium]|nr:nucleotidyltransferase family protein [Tepidanaerobacteraceae bacterium]
MTSAHPAIELLRIIGSPFLADRAENPVESNELYQYAFKNRIGLLYLLALKERDRLDGLWEEYEKLDYRMRETLVTAARVAKVLNEAGINYVVFKTIRPYPATPNDTDIICLDSYDKALNALREAGYIELYPAPMQVAFSDPRGEGKVARDKRGGTYYVDLYKHAATDYFIYLSKSKLRRNVISVPVDSCSEVKVLRPEVELAAILMHSVFPEMSYGLESFYTTCYYFSQWNDGQFERFIKFAQNSHIVLPVRASLSITATLHQEAFGEVPDKLLGVLNRMGGFYQPEIDQVRDSGFKMPHKFGFTTFLRTFLAKLAEPSSLASLGVQAFHMLNPVFAKEVFTTILKRRTRETYVQM